MSKYVRIPGITAGSHSFTQVWKSGVTKTINSRNFAQALKSGATKPTNYYKYTMSLKTAYKGFVSQTNISLNEGWLARNVTNGYANSFAKVHNITPYSILLKIRQMATGYVY